MYMCNRQDLGSREIWDCYGIPEGTFSMFLLLMTGWQLKKVPSNIKSPYKLEMERATISSSFPSSCHCGIVPYSVFLSVLSSLL